MLPTLDDVAKHTGFSIATVSRVVNGIDGVRSEVRTAVEKAVVELGYVARRARNSHAPITPVRNERLIEVLLHRHSAQEELHSKAQGIEVGPLTSITSDNLLSRSWELSNGFYRTMLDGILAEMQMHGGKTIVQVVTDLTDPALIEGFNDNLDGVLIVGEGGPDVNDFLGKCRIPVVLVDILHPAGGQEVVTTDNLAGIGQAVEHLADLGHRRLGYISGTPNASADERATGFSFHCDRLNLSVVPGWEAVAYDSIANTTERLVTLLSRPQRPTAIACCNDWGALAAYHAAARCQLRIPQDVSVVGFDDGLVAMTVMPPLTTIRVAGTDIGRLAVRLVLSQSRRENGSITRLPTRLIQRGSTAAVNG